MSARLVLSSADPVLTWLRGSRWAEAKKKMGERWKEAKGDERQREETTSDLQREDGKGSAPSG
jgi:hypothetical protein